MTPLHLQQLLAIAAFISALIAAAAKLKPSNEKKPSGSGRSVLVVTIILSLCTLLLTCGYNYYHHEAMGRASRENMEAQAGLRLVISNQSVEIRNQTGTLQNQHGQLVTLQSNSFEITRLVGRLEQSALSRNDAKLLKDLKNLLASDGQVFARGNSNPTLLPLVGVGQIDVSAYLRIPAMANAEQIGGLSVCLKRVNRSLGLAIIEGTPPALGGDPFSLRAVEQERRRIQADLTFLEIVKPLAGLLSKAEASIGEYQRSNEFGTWKQVYVDCDALVRASTTLQRDPRWRDKVSAERLKNVSDDLREFEDTLNRLR